MSYKLSIVKNKMMKRIINILILLCCIASLSSCGNSTEERSRVLKIYNWADYIDEDVLAEFLRNGTYVRLGIVRLLP